MEWLLAGQIAALSGAIFLALSYLYVHWRSPERYLTLWLVAWLAYPVRTVADVLNTITGGTFPVWSMLSSLATLVTVTLLLAGVLALNGRRLPAIWIALSAVVGAWAVIAPLAGAPFLVAALPLFTYMGAINIWAGLAILRHVRQPGIGRYLSGGAFILWGLHRLDYPFLRPVEWFAPWGYLIASLLTMSVALGILILYFEKVWFLARRQREQIDQIADNASDLIFRLQFDPAPVMEYLGPSVQHFTGYAPQEFFDQPELIVKVVHPDDYRLAEEYILKGIFTQPLAMRLLHREHGPVWAEMYLAPLRDDGGQVVGLEGVARDVTAQKQRERELEAIASITIALRDAVSQRDVQRVTLDHITDLIAPDGSSFGIHDPETGETTFSDARGVWAEAAGVTLGKERNVTAWVIETGQPYFTGHPPDDPEFWRPELVSELKVACLPLIANQQVIGVVGIAQHDPISEEEVRVLVAVADITASALYRARLVESLEQRVAIRTSELAAANQRLRELDLLKSRFVTDVSHELRTPVTSLSLYIQLLEQGKKEKQAEYLLIMRQEIERLAGLVQSVLDLSRLELDSQEVILELVDPNSLVEQTASIYRLRAEAGGIALLTETSHRLPPVKGNREQLVQMLTNLVVNALNYTEHGQIVLATESGEENTVCLRVQDTGIGIDPDDMAYLFERFYRGRPASALNVPGTGVGLAIVREIVQRHAGRIEVESTPGKGSTFRIWLPSTGVDEAVG